MCIFCNYDNWLNFANDDFIIKVNPSNKNRDLDKNDKIYGRRKRKCFDWCNFVTMGEKIIENLGAVVKEILFCLWKIII